MSSSHGSASQPEGQDLSRGLWYALPLAVSAIVPLITLPFLTRALTTHDYGAWALSTAYATLAAGLANPGLLFGFERGFFAAPDPASRARLLYSVVGFASACLLAVGVATWFARGLIATWILDSSGYGTLVMLSYAQQAVATVKGYYLLYYRGLGEAKSYALFSIDEVIVGSVLSVGLVVVVGMGINGLALGQLIGTSGVLAWAVVKTAVRLKPAFGRKPLVEALRVGYPLTPRVFVGTLSNQIDKYTVGMLQSVSGVGPYIIGQRLAYVAFSVSTAFEHVFVPRVYARMFQGGPDAPREIGQYLTPFAYLTAAAACLVALFAEEVVSLLTPPAYHQAAQVAGILAIAYAVMFFGKLPQLVYKKRTWVASILSFVTLVLNFAFCVVGVRLWGVLGAAWGFLGTCITSGAVGFAVRQHFYPIGWEGGRLAGVFALLGVCSMGPMALKHASVAYPWRLGFKAAGLVALVWLGARLGVVTIRNARLVLATITLRIRR